MREKNTEKNTWSYSLYICVVSEFENGSKIKKKCQLQESEKQKQKKTRISSDHN